MPKESIEIVIPEQFKELAQPSKPWRLMGFSDEDFEKAQGAGISNSQLYKQAGNSIVVDVLMAILNNLIGGKDDGTRGESNNSEN